MVALPPRLFPTRTDMCCLGPFTTRPRREAVMVFSHAVLAPMDEDAYQDLQPASSPLTRGRPDTRRVQLSYRSANTCSAVHSDLIREHSPSYGSCDRFPRSALPCAAHLPIGSAEASTFRLKIRARIPDVGWRHVGPTRSWGTD